MWRIVSRRVISSSRSSRSFAIDAAVANVKNATSPTRKKIAIVGGGVAGLQTAKVLSGHGHDCTVYEKSSSIGGVWRSNYSSFGLQVPKQLYEFPNFPFDECPSGTFPKGEEVQRYIQRYATNHQLNDMVRLNTSVESCQQLSSKEGSGWVITTKDQSSGNNQTDKFDYLVICSGMYSRPNLPQFDGQDSFPGKIVHSSEYTDNSMGQNQHVVVVGGAKSAIDLVLESSKVSKRSTIVMTQAHWATPHYIGIPRPFLYHAFSLPLSPITLRPDTTPSCSLYSGVYSLSLTYCLTQSLIAYSLYSGVHSLSVRVLVSVRPGFGLLV